MSDAIKRCVEAITRQGGLACPPHDHTHMLMFKDGTFSPQTGPAPPPLAIYGLRAYEPARVTVLHGPNGVRHYIQEYVD